MVLADNNFVSITAAVEEGRVTFDNIRKVTFFLVSTGAAEVAAILVAVWLQWPLILLPAQLLWLNLVTNGLQDVALAFEPAERGVLRRPPRRPGGGVLDRLLWERVVLAGFVMGAGMLTMFRWELDDSGSLIQAQTVALTTMVVFQVFQAGNSRSETESVFRRNPFSNRFLFVATVAALGIHVAALYLPPTQYVLRVEPIGIDAWVRLLVIATSIIVAMELHKALRHRRGVTS
jgi:magnesium-transporting ATPase (P-type)